MMSHKILGSLCHFIFFNSSILASRLIQKARPVRPLGHANFLIDLSDKGLLCRVIKFLREHSHKGVSGAAIANFRFGNFLSESPKDL